MNTQSTSLPLISIVLPVYNSGYYLPACLDSILKQSYKDFEVIAIDDFSRDDSWKVLKIYRSFDKRIKIYRNVKNYGKSLTFNRILRRVKGQFIVFMDPKDMMYTDKLKKQLGFLEKNEKVVAVGTQCTFINQENKRISVSSYSSKNDVIYHQPIHGISVHFETLMINRFLLPKDLLRFTGKDTILYSSLLINMLPFGHIVNLPVALQYHRQQIHKKISVLQNFSSLLQIGIHSLTQEEYRPSLRKYLFHALVKPTLVTSS